MIKSRLNRALSLILSISLLFTMSPVVSAAVAPNPAGAVPVIKQLPSLGLNSDDKMQPNGEIIVYVADAGSWLQAGKLPFDMFVREKTVDLGSFGKAAKVRLAKSGGGSAHLDAVTLGDRPPIQLEGAGSFEMKKVSARDNDLINVDENGMVFDFSSGGGRLLKVAARIEALTIGKTPFLYPEENIGDTITENSTFYNYKLNSIRGSLTLGQYAEMMTGKPFFQEFSVPASGHPPGFTYGWAINDDTNLYVVMDFTPDNTMDGDKDYAKVYVKTPAGVKEFKVSVPETRWGSPYFVYTDKVNYQHKVYQFIIPLSEIGAVEAGDISLAFSAYGTAASEGKSMPSLSYNSSNDTYLMTYVFGTVDWQYSALDRVIHANGTTAMAENETAPLTNYGPMDSAYDSLNNRFLVVWTDNSDIKGQLVNADGTKNGGSIPICNNVSTQAEPAVAYNSATNQYVVVWTDYRSGGMDIYSQLVNADGTLGGVAGGELFMGNPAISRTSPDVTYDNINNKFLVTWRDYRNGTDYDIYGSFASVVAASLAGSGEFPISSAAGSQEKPAVAYDDSSEVFLVTWEDDRSGTQIYSRTLNSDTGIMGTELSLTDSLFSQANPSVACDPATHEFLVAWEDYQEGGSRISGRIITSDGNLSGSNLVINDAAGSQYNPAVGFSASRHDFLVAYQSGFPYDLGLTSVQTAAQQNISPLVPDPILQVAIRNALNKPTGELTTADLAQLTTLKSTNAGISDLTGLQYATNLKKLYLWGNDIVDISPLASLATNLEELWLSHNNIEDISPLANLDKLRWLYLDDNSITAIDAVYGKSQLEYLNLNDNGVYDLSKLSGLTALKGLGLGGNYLVSSDLADISGLTSLEELNIERNSEIDSLSGLSGLQNLQVLIANENWIASTAPLQNLTNLRVLYLWNNLITDISSLQYLTGLQKLWLNNNSYDGIGLTDISVLSGLTNLTVLGLQDNDISDISPLAGLTKLQYLFLQNNPISSAAQLMTNSTNGGLGSGDHVYVSGTELTEAQVQPLVDNGVDIVGASPGPG